MCVCVWGGGGGGGLFFHFGLRGLGHFCGVEKKSFLGFLFLHALRVILDQVNEGKKEDKEKKKMKARLKSFKRIKVRKLS